MVSNEFIVTSMEFVATSNGVEASMNGWVYPRMGYPWCGFPRGFHTMLFLWSGSPGESTAWGTHESYTPIKPSR